MRKILLLPGPYGFSHSTRLWELGKFFSLNGYKVAVCLNSEQKKLSWDFAVAFKSPDFPEMQNSKEHIYQMAGVSLIDAYVQSEIHAINQFAPEVIIADLRPTARISSRLKNIPLITLENAALSKHFNPFDFFGLSMPVAVQNYFRRRSAKKISTVFRQVARKYNFKDLSDIFDFINGDQNWICDLINLFPITDPSGSTFFVGPFIFETPQLNSSDLPENFKKGEKILIYASLGNSKSFDLIPLFIQSFEADPNVNLVITTGLFQKTSMEGLVRNNIYITSYICGSEILPFADIAIHHGGSGSMYQALKYQVPCIVLPINIEQKMNALAIEQSETGVILDIEKLTSVHLYKKVQQAYVHRHLLRRNAVKLSNEVEEKLDKAICLDLIEGFLSKKSPL